MPEPSASLEAEPDPAAAVVLELEAAAASSLVADDSVAPAAASPVLGVVTSFWADSLPALSALVAWESPSCSFFLDPPLLEAGEDPSSDGLDEKDCSNGLGSRACLEFLA